MDIKTFADQIRHHDWTACMSDSYACRERADHHQAELEVISKISDKHAELWQAAREHYVNFTWELRSGEPLRRWQKSAEVVNAAARAWVRAYAVAKGGDPVVAESFVGDVNGFEPWYGCQISTAQRIHWQRLDSWLSGR